MRHLFKKPTLKNCLRNRTYLYFLITEIKERDSQKIYISCLRMRMYFHLPCAFHMYILSEQFQPNKISGICGVCEVTDTIFIAKNRNWRQLLQKQSLDNLCELRPSTTEWKKFPFQLLDVV